MRAWIAGVGLGAVAVVVLCITLSPTTVDHGREDLVASVLHLLHRSGVPESFGYQQLEFSANVLMFLPLGFFAGVLLRGRRRWWVAACLPLFSGLIEGTQALLLPERFATLADVWANTLGGWIGLVCAVLLGAVIQRVGRLESSARAAVPAEPN